ncbi:MAG: MarR family transcriptional regulator [Pseudomonadota bacterium]
MTGAGAGAGEPPLTEVIELLFFAYRDFTGEIDTRLESLGFGRAHHRVLYFVSRHPGLPVAELLDILKITKQSLARVLKQLVDSGYVAQETGQLDRRQRLLYPTAAGETLARDLTDLQITRVAGALKEAGPGSEEIVRGFLKGMVSAPERSHVDDLLFAAAVRRSASDNGA